MLRGVININLEEASEGFKAFTPYKENSVPLFNKLDAAQKSDTDDVEVFLSAEDAEMLMDSLPTPSEDESPIITSLRQKLLSYLKELREQGEI